MCQIERMAAAKIIYRSFSKYYIWDSLKRVSIIFAPSITNGMKVVFRRHNMQLVHSNQFKLKNKFIGTKDRTDSLNRPGVYAITCSVCNRKYYGQTKRSVSKRFCDHKNYIKNNEPRKSAIAAHILDNMHGTLNTDDVRLLKCVNDDRKLDAYESIYIQKDDNAINADSGNIESSLFRYC